MSRPKVSVSIITYNQRDYIGEAIESALAQQTDFPVKLNIGDDFSDDGTREILRDYAARYPEQITLSLQPKRPEGIAGRVNNITNLKSCEGEYIALLDGDDFWTDPHKLQGQVDFLDSNPAYTGAAHDCMILNARTGRALEPTIGGRSPLGLPDHPIDISQGELLDRETFQTSSLIFRRRNLAFPQWFERVYAADFAIFLMVAGHGPIRFVPQVQSVYRHHGGSIMAQTSQPDWARRFVADWPIFFEQFPATATFRQRMKLLRARRIAAIAQRQWLTAASASIQLLIQDPGAVRRQFDQWSKDRA